MRVYMGIILCFVSQVLAAAVEAPVFVFLHYIKLGRVSGSLSIRGERCITAYSAALPVNLIMHSTPFSGMPRYYIKTVSPVKASLNALVRWTCFFFPETWLVPNKGYIYRDPRRYKSYRGDFTTEIDPTSYIILEFPARGSRYIGGPNRDDVSMTIFYDGEKIDRRECVM